MQECEPLNLDLHTVLPGPRFCPNLPFIVGRLMRLMDPRRIMSMEGAMQATLDGAVIVALQVQPGAARASLAGCDAWRNRIVVRLTARAQAGQANRALCAQLATWLGCATSAITILDGHTSRQKRVRVEGMSVASVLERLAAQSTQDDEGGAHP